MTAGRPAKPSVLKILAGNPGKRALNKGEPTPPCSTGEPPAWLKVPARKVWDELAPIFLAEGLLTDMDVEAFAHACKWIVVARRDNSPTSMKATDLANRILARFGWSPSDRAKVVTTKPTTDAFDEFLKRAAR